MQSNQFNYILCNRKLTDAELDRWLQDNQLNMIKQMAGYGQMIVTRKQLIPLSNLMIFQENYQHLIQKLFRLRNNPTTNNFSLHLINLISFSLVNLDKAKKILKKTCDYIKANSKDPVLFSICLNNLGLIQKSKKKYYKACKLAWTGMEIMQEHVNSLKKKGQNKKQVIDDTVILVSLLIICKNSTKHILKTNYSKLKKKIYELSNYLGYHYCIKFLGQDSGLIKKFTPVQKIFHLPVFKTEEAVEPKKEENSNEQLIIKTLQNIYEALRQKKGPEYIVINQPSNIIQPKVTQINQSQQSIHISNQIQQITIQQPRQREQVQRILPSPPKPVVKQPEPASPIMQIFSSFITPKPQQQISVPRIRINQIEIFKKQEPAHEYVPSQQQSQQSSQPPLILAEQTICINKWQIKLRLQKQREQYIGNLIIDSTNKKQNKHEVIPEQKILKIIQQINVEDKLSYQIINEQLKEEEFLEYFIKPFMNISVDGQISLYPKSMGLLKPYQIKFINQDCFVFFNHIRYNLFRISLSAFYSCKSVYLNIEFCPQSMLNMFTFQQQTMDLITAIFKSITNSQQATIPQTIKDKNKLCKIIDEAELMSYLTSIISQFQNLLINREDQTSVHEIIENQLFYYKYQQIDIKKGKYYLIRYLPGINCFDIYIQNNYQTYSMDGKIKSRGNALYKSQDFLQDFGIPLRFSKHKLFAYIQIIARKYELLTFQHPLNENDNDRYVENAILQCPITQNCFKTKFFKKQNEVVPITISMISVNSQIPVGIKVVQYNPISCKNRGFFIHIIPQWWLRPFRRPAPWTNSILFKHYISQFEFRRDYFLPQWLQKSGFTTLFQKILDPQSSLYLQQNINRFMRGTTLIKIFNNEETV